MSRLVLCETDHASGTGNIRGGIICASDDAETLREWAMMTSSVVVTSFSMRSRNLGRAEKTNKA